MEVKIVISYPDGKTEQKELRDEKANNLLGKKIGDLIEGGVLDVKGDLVITGGSDRDGFPMRRDIDGPVRKKVFLSSGVGFNPTEEGERRKKRVRGNMITDEIIQVNTKLVAEPQIKPKEKKPEKKAKEKKEPAKEPIPLTDVKGIGKKRAEKLRDAGIHGVKELLSEDINKIAEETGISEKVIEKFKKAAEEVERT